MPTLQSAIRIPPDVLCRDIGGEAVILNLATGRYFGLNAVGARMWALLVEHGQVAPAYATLQAEYDVDSGKLERDLLNLVAQLAAHQLLDVDVVES